MSNITVLKNAEGAWPEALDRKMINVPTEGRWEIGVLPRGTQGGKSSIALMLRGEGGEYIFAQTTLLSFFEAALIIIGQNADELGVGVASLLSLKERQRQVVGEGYTSEHDDTCAPDGSLLHAAISYAARIAAGDDDTEPPSGWPWGREFWKPKTPIVDLVRASALIDAEVDRRLRAGESPA